MRDKFKYFFYHEVKVVHAGTLMGDWMNVIPKMRKLTKKYRKWDVCDLLRDMGGELSLESRWLKRGKEIDEYL